MAIFSKKGVQSYQIFNKNFKNRQFFKQKSELPDPKSKSSQKLSKNAIFFKKNSQILKKNFQSYQIFRKTSRNGHFFKKKFRVTRFFKKTSKIGNFSKRNQSYQTQNPKVAKNFQKTPFFSKKTVKFLKKNFRVTRFFEKLQEMAIFSKKSSELPDF